MDDLEIDRAVRATLSEEPSPEFAARVRTRIAEAPQPSIVMRWLNPAAAIVSIAVVALVVALPREQAPVTAEPSATHPPSAAAPVVPPTFPPAQPAAKPATPLPARAHVSTPHDPPLPEVIVAAEDVEAVRQFVSGARDRRFVATFEEAPSPAAWVMNDLAIAPITVAPLDSTQNNNN